MSKVALAISSARRTADTEYPALAGIVLVIRRGSKRKLIQGVVMRYLTSTIAACMLASTVGVFAQEQTPAPPAGAQAPAPPAAAQAPKSTLTGCVVQAKTTDGGTAYVLSKAEGGSATMYVLGGSSQPDVSANVNKKVEVTGPVQEPSSVGKDAAADPKVLRPPLIVVESVKVVAQSCS
jgi:hypothetical protein